jgi:hypothetical protein
MDFIVIEVNDFQLIVHDSHSSSESRAYAYITKDQLIFGEDALPNIKLSPDDFYSHFWQRLCYEEINCKNDSIRHFADLAYQQLLKITEKYDSNIPVVFITPSYYKEQELSLLLGLAQSCNLNTLALVNQDVINIEAVDYMGDYTIGQLGLHNCNLSNLTISKTIKLNEQNIFLELGFIELVWYISNWCNQKFIKHIRFDVFHSAHTEQSLFNQIYTLLIKLSNTGQLADTDISINEKSINLETQDLLEKIAEFFSVLFENKPNDAPLYFTHDFYNLIANTQYKNDGKRLKKPSIFALIQNLLPFIKQQSGVCLLEQIPTLKRYQQDKVININHATHIVFNHLSVAFKNKHVYLNNPHDKKTIHPFSRHQTSESFAVLTPNGNKITLTSIRAKSVTVNGASVKDNILLNNADIISISDNFNFELITVEEEF